MTLRGVRESVGNALYKQLGRASSQIHRTRPLQEDVLETDDSYLVVFDSPGVEPEDVQVRYVDGRVKIRVDRFREFYDGFEMRYPGRSMDRDGEASLPADAVVDPDAATARLTDVGTLEIDIPKHEPAETDETATDEIEIDD